MEPGQYEKIREIISKIQFIPDLPLKSEDGLKFGHKEIAKTIKDIVLNANQSMTLGLFGSWGTGKSSIVYNTENLLKIEEKSIPTIIFDVWKHKDDALRRTFLHEFIEQLKNKKIISEDKNLTDSVSKIVESAEDRSTIDPHSIKIPVAIFGLVSLILSIYFILVSTPPINYPEVIIKSLLFGFIFAWVYWLPNNLNFIITKNTTRIVEDKFSDPAQFEKEFIKIIGWLPKDTKKILIVFDNLDRVTEEKAVEVLKTIKTFLEPKFGNASQNVNIIFLIPCDNQAIHKHIQNMYFLKSQNHGNSSNHNGRESEEFLNKFFNCIITIPDFVPSEFEQYTLKQLMKSGISQFQQENEITNNVAWIIVQAYRNNPRRIIHFVNDLSGLYILLLNRVETGEFELDFIEKNLPQIAKFLVIEKKFPECLHAMISEGYANPQDFVVKQNYNGTSGRFFKEFVDSTRDIEIHNIFLFSRLRLSESEKEFPAIHHLFQLMETANKEEILQFIEQMKITKDNEIAFSNALKDELENKKISQVKIYFITSLFFIKTNTTITFSHALFVTIYNKINEDFNILSGIEPSLLYESLIIPKSIPERVNRIIEYWIILMPNLKVQYLHDILTLIFSEKIRVPENIKERYFNTIHGLKIDEGITSLICDLDYEVQEKYLDSVIINNLIKSKHFITGPNGVSRINQISSNLITQNAIIDINTGIKSFLNENFLRTNGTIQKDTFEELAEFAQYNADQYEQFYLINGKSFEEFSNFMIDISRKIKSPYISLPYLIEFSIISSKIKNPGVHDPVMIRINELVRTDPKLLKSIFNENVVNKLYHICKPLIDQIIINEQNIELFSAIFPSFSQEQKKNVMGSSFKFNENYGIRVSNRLIQEGIDPLISPETFENSIKKIIANFAPYSFDDRIKFLEIVNYTKCFKKITLIDLYLELMKKLLAESDLSARAKYLSSFEQSNFIPDDRSRDFIKFLLDEMFKGKRPVETDITNLLLTKKAQMTDEEKKELIQLIFDEIRRQTNPDKVQILFSQLNQLDVKYHTRKQNFEDIKLKIEKEENPAIKNSLISGLMLFEPKSPTSQESIDFWSQIKNIRSPM